jgi:hypothetical protein
VRRSPPLGTRARPPALDAAARSMRRGSLISAHPLSNTFSFGDAMFLSVGTAIHQPALGFGCRFSTLR